MNLSFLNRFLIKLLIIVFFPHFFSMFPFDKCNEMDAGNRNTVRYSIYSGDPDGYFSIDPTSGNIRIANTLDHETKPQVLLNIQATSGEPPVYGHTQVITIQPDNLFCIK